jgi:CheY-like chemotaxis protein
LKTRANLKEMLANIKVLIVDDDPLFLDVMAFEFQRRGFSVFSSKDGAQAFDIVQRQKIDIVISDICMPNVDGIELLDKLKALKPELPMIILMTGYDEITSNVARKKGAEGVFSKPFDRNALVEAVIRLVVKQEVSDAINENTNLKIQINGSMPIKTHAVSVSLKGVFVELCENFPQVNDTINLDLILNGDQCVSMNGVVKWVCFKTSDGTPSGAGVEFFDLNSIQQMKLSSIMKKMSL